MSRIGKLPVPLPSGVTVSMDGRNFSAKGPKGELTKVLPQHVSVEIDDSAVRVQRDSDERIPRAMHGLARSLVRNVVEGVATGFSKTLEINGVGYRVQQKKDYLVFSLGYSHPIYYEVPKGLEAKIESPANPAVLKVNGIDKELVGQAAAEIRSFRPPEPYKGKGIKYSDEVIRRKEGKSGAR
jgi:large subunit ribosomal protein L6